MFGFLRHHFHRLHHALLDYALPVKRSGQWKTVEKHFLEANPTCAACGTKRHLQVHHMRPLHLFPALELSTENLITLCMTREHECHYRIGHGQNWKSFNPNVREDAANALAHPENFEHIVKMAVLQAKS
jgi:5-methylcytosine-specific restriction enzyme A